MSVPPPNVKPGEIISSDLINFILTELDALDSRVLQLESGGPSAGQVVISGFDPPAQIAAGQVLSILGTGFDFPPDTNQVSVDGTSITSFRPDSTGSLLKFIVPESLVIPSTGKNAIVTVTNQNGEDSKLYRLLPAVVASGDPPVISNVTPATGLFLLVNEPIIITGGNFAADPSENIIRFLITSGGQQIVYPQSNQTLTIDTNNSDAGQIDVTVPDIVEIPAGQSQPVTLEVGVGAHVPAVANINIRRL